MRSLSQRVDNKDSCVWRSNCYEKGASDVPAAGRNSGQPQEQQTPGKSHRQRRGPEKGKTGRGSLQVARWRKPPARPPCWEASDQQRDAKRRSQVSGVCASGQLAEIAGPEVATLSTVFSNPRMSLKVLFEAGSFRCLLSGFFHTLLVLVVAVGMWESVLSISKDCGKGGKRHHRFPPFPQAVISTVHFHCRPWFRRIFLSSRTWCILPVASVVRRRCR